MKITPPKILFLISFTLLFMIRVGLTSQAAAGDFEQGRRLYQQYCAPCHGKEGKGDGTRVTVENLDPSPRNHADGSYMNKRTDLHLFKVIFNGGYSMNLSHGMPQWKHILTKNDIFNVIAYVRKLAIPPYSGIVEKK